MIKLSDVPNKFTGEYYDGDYFATPKGKKFKRPNGSIDGWSYESPDGEWHAARSIAEAWKEVFNPKNILDVGAGRGTFIAYARDVGIEAEGFDFSEWAVNDGRYNRCRPEWLKLHDATHSWPYDDDSFDLVIALDFYEHIYSDDLQFVIDELYRVARKWIFLQIAIVCGGNVFQKRKEKGYILKKDVPVPIGLEGCAVSGHVTVQDETWWFDKFENEEWTFRKDMVNHFCSLVDHSIIKNWVLNLIMIYEKLDE